MSYVLYELETGRAHSQSSTSFDNPNAEIYGIKQTDNTGIWNESTLDFDPIPPSKKMTTLAFMELFTDTELIGILDAAKVSTEVQLFVMKLEQAEFMDLEYQPTVDGINAMVFIGLLTQERADEVLNG